MANGDPNAALDQELPDTKPKDDAFLRKLAWDYFATHASQRMSIFNFYIALSSVVTATYFASFKNDSNLQSARPILALLLLFFSFIFWKLDERNKVLIKNSERALRFFERTVSGDVETKVFTKEKTETDERRARVRGIGKLLFWRLHLSYSDCFNLVFTAFALVGFGGLIPAIYGHLHFNQWCSTVRHLLSSV